MLIRSAAFLLTATLAFAGPEIVAAGKVAEFTAELPGIVGLSGLTWGGGDLYYAVSDRQQAILPLRVTLDAATGLITAVKADPPVPVPTKVSDFEDIAWDAGQQRLFISAEQPASLLAFSLKGQPLPAPALPAVFQQARRNLSMEALTRDQSSGRLWTANEDTLTPDGAVSSDQAGGVVRLQEFDAEGRALRQFAWRTETSGLRVNGSGTGVSGLCLLPDGSLVVMERVVVGVYLEVRLYLAGFSGATDTSQMPALAGANFTRAQKKLLFRKVTGLTNYEGIAAGPSLTDGSRALLLVADSGKSMRHTFMALRLAGEKKP